jgi:hypothetical protein
MAGAAKFSTLGANVAELQIAAGDRLLDAELLFAGGRFASAIAMSVYSLEIHLKVRICLRLNVIALPKAFEIHELEGLLVLTGLQAALKAAPPAIQRSWQDMVDVSLTINELRYSSSTWNQADAQAFLQKLRDTPDGVLPWLLSQP